MFKRLLNLVPGNGKVFFWSGSKNLKEITSNLMYVKSEGFDLGEKNSELKYTKGVLTDLKSKKILKPELIGAHNYRNAEAALRVCLSIAPNKRDEIVAAFLKFPGVKRRQEALLKTENSLLVEDFAHHPVAIFETVKAHKEAYPNTKIISLFEPRSATSHRNIFQDDFAKCFKGSDLVIVSEVYQINKVTKNLRLNVKKLIKDIQTFNKKPAIYVSSPKEIPSTLKKMLPKFAKDNIIVLAMSNGAFGGIYPDLKQLIQNREII
jgi:UDP-N-acetylmuramate: L-alanyl-gamma-D-glutamyl-meso-diaminopimelate ligase